MNSFLNVLFIQRQNRLLARAVSSILAVSLPLPLRTFFNTLLSARLLKPTRTNVLLPLALACLQACLLFCLSP